MTYEAQEAPEGSQAFVLKTEHYEIRQWPTGDWKAMNKCGETVESYATFRGALMALVRVWSTLPPQSEDEIILQEAILGVL